VKPADLHAFFDQALALGAMVHLHEGRNPGVAEQLLVWAKSRDLRCPVELKSDPALGSWRTFKVEHGRCTIAVDTEVERELPAKSWPWRPSDGAVKP